ncbi:hypothetical protein IWZ00DRAFT_47054 [Phyllosticta capitalensis]
MLGEEEDIPGGCVVGAPPDSQRGKEEKTTRTRTGQSFRGDKRRRDTRRSSNSSIAHPVTIYTHHARQRGGCHTRTDRSGQSDMAFRSRRDPYSPHQTNPLHPKRTKDGTDAACLGLERSAREKEGGNRNPPLACFLDPRLIPRPLYSYWARKAKREERLWLLSPVQFSSAPPRRQSKDAKGAWVVDECTYPPMSTSVLFERKGKAGGGTSWSKLCSPCGRGLYQIEPRKFCLPGPTTETANGGRPLWRHLLRLLEGKTRKDARS